MKHEVIEKAPGLLGVLIAITVSIGGLAEIVPLMMSAPATSPHRASKPCTALQARGPGHLHSRRLL